MFRKEMVSAFSTVLLLTACSGEPETAAPAADAASTPAAPAASVLPAAVAALGASELASITYSGTAWRVRNSFRQTPSASPPWPSRDTITNYRRTIDLTTPAQPVSLALGDTFASNLFLDPPVAGTYTQNIQATQTAWGQQLEVWLTPWGFLKGAELYGATEVPATVDGASLTAVTWQTPTTQVSPSGLQYTVTGYINSQNLVERVETKVEDAFMGDMAVANVYSDYKDFGGGLMVPATIEQQRGGGGIFGVTVEAASANPANLAELTTPPPPPTPPGGGAPAPAPAGGAPAAPVELSQQIAEGVYWIKTGYTALAVEFTDYIAVFEAGGPAGPAIGEQILAEVKRLFPGKEIRYVINSHPHSDHTGGLPPFAREGVTIVTHANNVDFLNMALSTPRTLLGEETLMPKFEAVNDMYVLEDANHRLELHHIPNDHTDGMLVAYLPKERVLIEADFTLPVNGAKANPFVINLANYVDTHGLDFDQYLAVHAAAVPQTKKDLMATIGK
ncbi:MAG: MBL fold metallo-hydrolase [Pseudomonadota bacterium]